MFHNPLLWPTVKNLTRRPPQTKLDILELNEAKEERKVNK